MERRINFQKLEDRIEPIKLSHYETKEEGNNTVKAKKEKIYSYYICDYCGQRIVIEKDRNKRTGGLARIPVSNIVTLDVALHNGCLNKTLEQVREYYNVNI